MNWIILAARRILDAVIKPDPRDARFTDLTGWRLIFVENFQKSCNEGRFLNVYGDKWGAYRRDYLDTYGQAHPGERSHYEPNIMSVIKGSSGALGNVLAMHLHVGSHTIADAPADNLPWGAAPFPIFEGKADSSQLYGRYEVRMRCKTPNPGWKTSFLLWPVSENWPTDGEINWPEGNLEETVFGYVHHQDGVDNNDQDFAITNITYNEWHTFVIEWKPGQIKFLCDGVLKETFTTRIPNTPMRWVLQTETSLDENQRPKLGQETIVEIDHVACWSYNP